MRVRLLFAYNAIHTFLIIISFCLRVESFCKWVFMTAAGIVWGLFDYGAHAQWLLAYLFIYFLLI